MSYFCQATKESTVEGTVITVRNVCRHECEALGDTAYGGKKQK